MRSRAITPLLILLLSGCSTPLFNGRDLSGWQGLVEPPLRDTLSPQDLAACQADADQNMRDHWHAEDGILVFDGRGENLCTIERFRDFELELDWKILPRGDSGIYLRGSPQVQIWDNPIGSGGLYNNKLHPSNPLAIADRRPGQWNHFRIRMVGERVTVWLNGTLVVNDTPMENYWDRTRPIFPEGPIELQSHGDPLYFRNIRVRRL
jgi:hypothetical protein